jgi:hypothetical protein
MRRGCGLPRGSGRASRHPVAKCDMTSQGSPLRKTTNFLSAELARSLLMLRTLHENPFRFARRNHGPEHSRSAVSPPEQQARLCLDGPEPSARACSPRRSCCASRRHCARIQHRRSACCRSERRHGRTLERPQAARGSYFSEHARGSGPSNVTEPDAGARRALDGFHIVSRGSGARRRESQSARTS